MNGHTQPNSAQTQAQAPVASSSSSASDSKAAPLFGQQPAPVPQAQVTLNGHTYQPSSSSSRPGSVYSHSHSQSAAAAEDKTKDCELADYLYNQGFLRGQFADVQLDVQFAHQSQRIVYNLHRLVLARSPVLQARLAQSQSPSPSASSTLSLELSDPYITPESLLVVLGTLYASRASQRLTQDNAQAVLAASTYLQHPSLIAQSTALCARALAAHTSRGEPHNTLDWLHFVELHASDLLKGELMRHLAQTMPRDLKAFASGSTASGSRPQTPTPDGASQSQTAAAAAAAAGGGGGSVEGQQKLMQTYAHLPLPVFKSIIESPLFPPSDMERFAFAKRCIVERKKVQGPNAPTESAVLAFGSNTDANKGSNVEIVAKGRRGRALWKVGE